MERDRSMAVIDMGTNTFHLLVAQVRQDQFSVIYREKVSVRLGKGGISKGMIAKDAWERAVHALVHFRKVLDRHGITEIHATATSAIRNANNGKDLAADIFRHTGIEVRIISGDEEAQLIYYGVKKAMDIGSRRSLIMDIGGGSVEFIICNQDEILYKQSFEIGAQRLLDRFQKTDPIQTTEVQALEAFLTEQMPDLIKALQEFQPKVFIGSSGTFDTLSDIYRQENNIQPENGATEFPLPIAEFLPIHEELVQKSRDERLKIPGMIEMRVDMIVVASCLIHWLMKQIQFDDLRVSAYALKEGILHYVVNEVQHKLDA